MNTCVEFAAVNAPFANRFTLHILAAAAEYEARQISRRTKNAIAAAKADPERNLELGNSKTRNGLPTDVWRKGLLATRVARRDLRDQALDAVADMIRFLRAIGYATVRSR
jgi:DNA invertase Pin-like site-specific DNA recombinase